MLPEDLSLVAQVMVDGVWHAPAPGSLCRAGEVLSWREGTNPAAFETVTAIGRVSAVMVDSKKKAEAEAKQEASQTAHEAHAPAGSDEDTAELETHKAQAKHASHGHAKASHHKGGK